MLGRLQLARALTLVRDLRRCPPVPRLSRPLVRILHPSQLARPLIAIVAGPRRVERSSDRAPVDAVAREDEREEEGVVGCRVEVALARC